MIQQIVDWLDERIDLSGLKHFVAEKGVPVHAQEVWYYLGGLTLFLFVVQVFTGILLLLYYRPAATEAYSSSSRACRSAGSFATSTAGPPTCSSPRPSRTFSASFC